MELVREADVTLLVDIRRFPGSRRLPHFGRLPLAGALAEAGITYRHLVGLGGRRPRRPDSVNAGWRNAGFQGFADHMVEPDFKGDFERLVTLANSERVVIMCAEAVPWRCHRWLLADALTVAGIEVRHLLGPGKTEEHRLTPFARFAQGVLTYPGAEAVGAFRVPSAG